MTAVKKSSTAKRKRAEINKVTKIIQNPNTKSSHGIRSRGSYPQRQDDEEDNQQSYVYSRHNSASPEPMKQFVEAAQFNALANEIISINAKLDKIIAMFQRIEQTIASDNNPTNDATPPALPSTGNTHDTTPNEAVAEMLLCMKQTISPRVISRKLEIKDLIN
jgi:hypothetical protein